MTLLPGHEAGPAWLGGETLLILRSRGKVRYRLLLSLSRSGEAVPSTSCVVPQSFVAGGDRPYLGFWAVTSNPRYPGYKTAIVAPEPSVEQVVKVGHLMGGRIGTHMMLQVLSRDLEV
jgi:hypothetical protein